MDGMDSARRDFQLIVEQDFMNRPNESFMAMVMSFAQESSSEEVVISFRRISDILQGYFFVQEFYMTPT